MGVTVTVGVRDGVKVGLLVVVFDAVTVGVGGKGVSVRVFEGAGTVKIGVKVECAAHDAVNAGTKTIDNINEIREYFISNLFWFEVM
jgi:hypothetical protein